MLNVKPTYVNLEKLNLTGALTELRDVLRKQLLFLVSRCKCSNWNKIHTRLYAGYVKNNRMAPLSCFIWISQLFQFKEIPIHSQSKNQTKGIWWMEEYDINGMCCFLIPWDWGICDRGNSCPSGGKFWSPANTVLLYRQHKIHSGLCAAPETHCHCRSRAASTEAAKQWNIRKRKNEQAHWQMWVPESREAESWPGEWERISLCLPTRVSSPDLPSLIEGLVPCCWDFELEGSGDHTAPGGQPLSSNPLAEVMTLSNLDHLLKHVLEQSALRCVKNPTPLPNHRSAAGWLLAARRQGQGRSSALRGDTHTDINTYAHARVITHKRVEKLHEMGARKPPVIVTWEAG